MNRVPGPDNAPNFWRGAFWATVISVVFYGVLVLLLL